MTLSHRRPALLVALALAAASAGPGLQATRAQSMPEGPIIVANWGGQTNETYDISFIEPYTAETGIEVQQVDAPGLFVARTQAQAESGRMEWDMLESVTDTDVAFLARAGLLEPMPADLKQRLTKQLGAENVNDYGYHSGMSAMLIVCQKERVKACPQNIMEFWDIQSFPEKRAIIGFNPIYPVTSAQLALGVPRDETATTPIDVDAVFAKLEELRPAVSVIYTSTQQGTQVLEQGEADMAIYYVGRIYGELLPTGNYEVVWTDGVRAQGTTVVLKGAPHRGAAWHFFEWNAMHLESQARFATLRQKTPIDAAALELLPPEMREQFPNAPEHKGKTAVPNAGDFIEKFDDINRRWQEFVAG